MDEKNKNISTIMVILIVFIIGILIGYIFRTNGMHFGFLGNGMYKEMRENMYDYDYDYEDEIITGDGAMMHAMDEMMLNFRGKTGEEYEEAFLRGMIVHHLGAVRMAEDLLKQTKRPELIGISSDIIKSQSEEIEKMRGWLDSWFINKN